MFDTPWRIFSLRMTLKASASDAASGVACLDGSKNLRPAISSRSSGVFVTVICTSMSGGHWSYRLPIVLNTPICTSSRTLW